MGFFSPATFSSVFCDQKKAHYPGTNCFAIWVASCWKVPKGHRGLSHCRNYIKRRIGRVCIAMPNPSFGMIHTFWNLTLLTSDGVSPKEGWVRPRANIFLLVWQQLKPLAFRELLAWRCPFQGEDNSSEKYSYAKGLGRVLWNNS